MRISIVDALVKLRELLSAVTDYKVALALIKKSKRVSTAYDESYLLSRLANVYLLLGHRFMLQDNASEALKMYSKALSHNKDDVRCLYARAGVRLMLEEAEEATKDVQSINILLVPHFCFLVTMKIIAIFQL